ncbi:MAG: Holliday junction resolvase RuvX [Holosporales bacterium]|jgi:putative Holliday junction resolvase|nr:Holliday junction resolvase RuvX [Holosporales bacterium]
MMSLNAFDFRDLLASFPGRIIGIDVGERRTGLALSDLHRCIASPWQLVCHASLKQGIISVADFISKEDIAGMVIGWPVEMSGNIGAQCKKVQKFAETLSLQTSKSFFLWDERLSTAAVARTLKEVHLSRKKYATTIDKTTAAYLLQGALDYLNFI